MYDDLARKILETASNPQQTTKVFLVRRDGQYTRNGEPVSGAELDRLLKRLDTVVINVIYTDNSPLA